MNGSKKIVCVAMLAIVACLAAGCAQARQPAPQAAMMVEATVRETAEIADPQGAMQSIYDSLEDKEITELTKDSLQKTVRVSTSSVSEYLGYLSDPKSGLADMVVLLPLQEKRDEVREALYQYKEYCVEQYRNYDILDSYTIAQNAEVFDQGDYMILLMMPDNEAAREIIDQYMPI